MIKYFCITLLSSFIITCVGQQQKTKIYQVNQDSSLHPLDTVGVFNTNLRVCDLSPSNFDILKNMARKNIEVRKLLPDSIASSLFSLPQQRSIFEVEFKYLYSNDTSFLPEEYVLCNYEKDLPIPKAPPMFLGNFWIKANDNKISYECIVMFDNFGKIIDYLCYKVYQKKGDRNIYFSYAQLSHPFVNHNQNGSFFFIAILDNTKDIQLRNDGEVIEKVVFKITKTGKFERISSSDNGW